MRRHEASPPRRPRVLTPRLVAVSLVIGVVLAVVSVPVAAVAFHEGTPSPRSLVLAEYFEEDGRLTLARLYTTGHAARRLAAARRLLQSIR